MRLTQLWMGTIASVSLMLGAAINVNAAVSPEEAQALKGDLTPFGAERAGNAEGTIPEWTGGFKADQIPAGYEGTGDHHPNPFPDDKPLFVITAQNMAQYADKLSEGQKALFKAYPDTFKMPIYPSRRTHSAPDWVYDNTFNNATTARLASEGNGIAGAIGGIPFPIPEEGGEVHPLMIMWNHVVRWRGIFLRRNASEISVQRNGSFSLVRTQQDVNFLYYTPGITEAELNNRIFLYLSLTTAPARLAGGAVLVHETLDQTLEPRQAWTYNAGQRRVRRAPNLAYDTPIDAADGLRTADDTDIYNGAPDRYNWTFLGKKEIYLPYNNYDIGSDQLKYDDVFMKGHVNPAHTRYELHRAWVVEANLKEGARHIYSKRRFYADEDSWTIALVDQYDSSGELWRVSIAYLKQYYDIPGTWSALDVFHDLQSRRLHAQNLVNEEAKNVTFTDDPPPAKYFSPQALRRLGRR